MNITYLELTTNGLHIQWEYYSKVLELPVRMFENCLQVIARNTEILFTKSDTDFDGAYHFAFNIPENQFRKAKKWISSRTPLLTDDDGKDEFHSDNWNSKSVYFKDAAGNVLEFIARHNLKNAVKGSFDSSQILNVSEIGLPSEDVIAFADELCVKMNLSVFKQGPSETFTPVGDDNGLLILPAKDRIWIPNSGVPAKLLPVKVNIEVNGKGWSIRGYPYKVIG
ncbi:MAG TPA: hypothetical protein VJ987_08695 [Anaerolineales bacterium]|nr:hypothetical protein [Anaerolineales bacterium]